jgi:putative endonuclease
MKRPCVYIMANRRNGTPYVGVTSDLGRRAAEHRIGAVPGFTTRYGCKLLVWREQHERMDEAIAREKQIKLAAARTNSISSSATILSGRISTKY